jgi:hypothetical protein
MINNVTLLKKVLTYIYEKEKITLDESIMNCGWGFELLQEKGYITIQKVDDEFFATLTLKGLKTLMH